MQRNSGIVVVLRRVTTLVKVAPFIVAFLLMITVMGYCFLPGAIIDMLDKLFYLSPLAVYFFLRLSKELYLCKWHRLECILPVVALVPDIIDKYIYPLSPMAADVNLGLITMIFLLSLINAYFVFIKR